MIKVARRTPTRARLTPWPFLYSVVDGEVVKNVAPTPRVRINRVIKRAIKAEGSP